MAESVLRIVIDSRNAERNARNIANELQNIERNGDHASRSMDSMSVATRSLVGYMGGLVTIGAAISKMDAYTGLQNRLKLVTGSQVELNTAMTDTFTIAQRTASSWDSVAMVYQRFADNADRLNISMQQTASLTETVSKAISISGGSVASAEAALMQFGQALASGVLRGEEFNSIAEQAPGLLKAIAFGLNTNVGSLRAMAQDGKITGDVLVDALGKAKPYIDDLFNKTDFTISQSFTKLSNEVTKFVGEAGKGSGAASALSGSISTLAENLELIADGAFVVGIGYITKAIATKTVAVYSSIAATTASIEAEKVAAAQTLRSALAEKTAAEAELTRARDAVVSAEMQVQADRKVIASEMQRIESSLAQVAAEKQLEIQRLKSQINDQGRIATSTRMAELQQVQASMTAELTVLERQLGATTVASSAQFVAAREAQVVATGNLAATTEVATVAQAQNNAVQRAGLLTSTGLVGALGGPLGLGITMAALAATYLMFKDSSDDVNDRLSSQIEVVSELAQKYRELTLEKLINEMGELEKKQAQGSAQSSKAIAGIMGIVVATEYSTQAQKERANEWDKIAVDVRNGAMLTGAAIAEMTKKGFTKEEIQKASAFFAEFNDGKVKANEAAQSIAFVTQQTGLYGDKLDETGKKIAEKKLIVKGLEGDYRSLSTQIDTNIQWLLQQDGALNTSAEQQKNIANATDAWNNKTITASELAKVLKANLPIDSGLLVGFDNLATKTDKAKKELNTANHELKQVQANGPKAKQGFADAATGAKDAESEVGKLNEKLKDFNKTLYDRDFDANFKKMALERTKLSEKEIQAVMEVTQELRKKGVALDSDAAKQLYAEAVRITKIEEQGNKILDARNEAEKEKTNQKTKQLKITQAELEVAKRSAALVESSGLGKYAESKGIPSSVIAGLLAQESKGIRDAKSHTGAIGYFQTTSSYRKQNNMSVADSYDLEKSGKIAIDNIAKVYEKTGDLAQAILSHNAGESGAKQFTKTGKVTGSAERNKEVSQYVGKVSRYADIIAGGVGKSGISEKDNDRAYSEQIKARLELVKQGLNLQEQYESEQAKRTKARNEEINLAQQTGQTALIPKIKERYDAEDKLAKLQQEFDVEGHKWTEERKLQYTYETNVERLTAEGKFSEDQKKILEKGLKDQYEQEKAFAILARETRIFQYKQALMTEAELVRERYRIEMLELSKLDIEERRIAMQAKTTAFIRGNLAPVGTPIIESDKGKSNTQLLQEETGRELLAMQNRHLAAQVAAKDNANELLRIDKEYLAAKEQLHAEHDIKLVDARQTDHDNQLQFYGQMLSQAGSVWGDMTQMIKDAKGENSKTFKAMFLAQQSMAIAQQIINTELAAGATTAQTGIFGLPAAAVIRGIGYASVGLIAAQTIAGFETGGYTGSGGRKDVAGVVHGQEYVLNAAATKRVGVGTLDAINSGKGLGGGGGGDVTITQHITFTESGAKVDTQGQKEIAQSLNNMMDAWARRESHQGGVLYKLTKG